MNSIGCFVLIASVAMAVGWLVGWSIEIWFNLGAIIQSKIKPSEVKRSEDWMKYNKKTGIWEQKRGKLILPYPNAFSIKNVIIAFLISVFFYFVF